MGGKNTGKMRWGKTLISQQAPAEPKYYLPYFAGMKILITGANGFLGYYLVEQLLARKFSVIATGKGECRLPFTHAINFQWLSMDFTDPFSIHDVFEKVKPDVVVHAGAMSKPDECELDQMKAYLVNVEGTIQLLINAEEIKSFFIFLSTDFVFDGERGMYSENDLPHPVNYYGRTKLEAEEAVKEYEYDWAIVRTVLVFGKNRSGNKNFLEIIREKLEKRIGYNVVDDQVRTPTYVEDLARGIVSIIEKKATGVFHLSGKDKMTPYQMAIRTAALLNFESSVLKKVTAGSFSQPARRPLKTGFKIDKAAKELGYQPVPFEEGLKKTFE